MQDEINRLERSLRELAGERDGISTDQQRLRQNMQSIDRTSDLYSRYLKKLNDQETRLEEIEREQNRLRAQLDQQRRAFEAFVRGLNVQ